MSLNDISFKERDPNEPRRPYSGGPHDDPIVEEEAKTTFEPLSIFGNIEAILQLICAEISFIPMLVNDEPCLVFWDCSTCAIRPGDPGARCKHEFGTFECMSAYAPNDDDILVSHHWLYELLHSGRIESLVRQRENLRQQGKIL